MIPVKCPHCKVGLKVDETKIPEGIASFKCPKCRHDIPVSYLKHEQSADSETVLIRPVRKECGWLIVVANPDTPEQLFPLCEGIFIIGRKASVSEATICIETEDKEMSRNHLRIEVKKDSRGSYIHMLSDYRSKNHTQYNGRYLDKDEVVVLKDNDEIKIGHTHVRFKE
ncbi:FHA domain-containing protein [Tannerella forsythia]|jgi:FHA domain.|uniref:FHA domain protein n=2 Tax=Tannerella forsythia TaxID=28112 RepID=G8UPQ8_TANFA|nr:FHA domain-containing protein [Tannerella forsythia]AEW21790.1 FHA domain protein [Tannerella forsythia 92A2]KKY60433.1 MJ0042 family finger-like domain-containing protein [Tannerella forsythia]OLQ21306.1 hypothetical protein BGK60_11510 [Tannerella forsythia]PDP43241.1 hypothetical protein CLI86_09405 [Tannerella forsythia]PDP70764.1 hypothetical protein CLI85_07870 [Tannerella forsythia]